MALYDPYNLSIHPEAPPCINSERCDQSKLASPAENHAADHSNAPLKLPSGKDFFTGDQKSQCNNYEEKQNRLQLWGLITQIVLCIFAVLSFGAAAYYSHIAYLQVGIMQRQLEATDRPWIQIASANVTDGLGLYRTYDKGLPGMHADIKLVAKNIGHSVAVHVKMTGRLIFQFPWDTDYTIWNRQHTICSIADPFNTTSEFTLFPEESTGDRLAGQLGCGGHELIPPDAFIQTQHETKWVDPIFAGCIIYQTSGSGERTHHTGFLYQFAVKYRDAPARANKLFRFGDNIPTERLVMVEHPFSFSDVN